jgi:alpha-ketoglutaric semialdehyde dehydrogenase
VLAAQAACAGWASRPGSERAAILEAAAKLAHERAEGIAHVITLETGKPLREARGEAARVATTLRFFAGDAALPHGELYAQSATGGQVYTRRRPRGVVGLITPWNFPVAIPAWKAAPALVAGNPVVLKPSEDAPMRAVHFARCLTDAGLPPGVLNVVIGQGPTPGATLVERPEVRPVSFTGSTAVGRAVRESATAHGRPVQLEMGGHNPLVAMADADLDRAVAAAYAGAFMAAGQKCTATRRSLATARRFTDEAQAGVIHINSSTTGAEVYVPFGGIKASGWGPHEQGRAALEFYTESVTVYEDA